MLNKDELLKVTEPDFLDKIILEARIDHAERLSQANGKVDDPAIEYADLLLRYYHRALLQKLTESGIKF